MFSSVPVEYFYGSSKLKICRPEIIDEPTWELKTFRYLQKLLGLIPQKRRIRLTFRRTFTPLVCILACMITVLTDLIVLSINEAYNNSTRTLMVSLGLHAALLSTALGLGITTVTNNATYVTITVILAGVNGIWDALGAYVCSSIVREVTGRIVRLQEFVGRYYVIQVISACTKIVSAACLGLYVGITILDVMKYRLCRPIEMTPFPEMAIRDPTKHVGIWKGWRESDSEPESFFSVSDEGIPLQCEVDHYNRRKVVKKRRNQRPSCQWQVRNGSRGFEQ